MAEHQPVGKHRNRHMLHVVGDDVGTAGHVGGSLRSLHPCKRPARADAELKLRMPSRSVRSLDQHQLDRVVHEDAFDLPLHVNHLFGQHHRLDPVQRVVPGHPRQQLDLLVRIRVSELNPHKETVKLRFGKTVGSFELQRILGREQQKRTRQEMRMAVHRYFSFLHRFKQRRLRPGRSPVQLVGQHQIVHEGTWTVFEFAALLAEYRRSRDVRRR